MRTNLHTLAAAWSACVAACIVTGFAYGMHAPPGLTYAHAWRVAGLLAIPGLALGMVAMAIAAVLPPIARVVGRWAERHVSGVTAALLVTPPLAILWLALTVTIVRHFAGRFHNLGLAALLLGALFLALAIGLGALGLLLGALIARRVERDARPVHRALLGPALLGVGVAGGLFVYGVATGDDLGRGGLFSGFAVLRQPAVDLIPTLMLACIVANAVVLTVILRRRGLIAAPVALAVALALAVTDARHYGRSPAGARIDARPGPVQVLVEKLRKAFDRDHDGHSAYFGGGDCDDHDPRRNPEAREVAGNGVDEDCSGRDAPAGSLAPAAQRPTHPQLLAQIPSGMNLVVLTVDTLRADMIGGARAHDVTPNLSRLAAEGVTFEHAYALSSNTMHAVGPMMVGQYPTECPRDDQHFTRYLPENVFLAERLRALGFWTGGMATHFYFVPSSGLTQGIERWDEGAQMVGEDSPAGSWDDRLGDRMIEALRRPETATGRFFLWGHFFDPHNPYAPHPGVGPGGEDDHAAYTREVAFTDRQIGRVLAALAAHPAAQRTVVVLTADHGEAFGEHGNRWHGVELWEELVRIPLVIRVPGVAPRRVSTPRSVIDLAPTLVDLMHAPTPAPGAPDAFSGVSLVGDLVGASEPARPIYIELTPDRYNRLRRAWMMGGMKLLERGPGRYELYDLNHDPGETHDLAEIDHASLARMLALRELTRARLRDVAPTHAVVRDLD